MQRLCFFQSASLSLKLIFITKTADQAIQQHENEKRLREKEDLSSLRQISPIFDSQEVAGKFEMDIKYYLP